LATGGDGAFLLRWPICKYFVAEMLQHSDIWREFCLALYANHRKQRDTH
jgi:hypothetical protein